MLRLVNFLFLLIPATIFCQVKVSQTESAELSDSTSIGNPIGNVSSKMIGAEGGSITSDDGRVELHFPAGALSANTAISIQPTSNLAPNGVGNSYWFEPSGIQFSKPVEIIFHYTDKEAEVCPPDWMSLGIQDHSGKWTFVDYEEFDSVSKTLRGYIKHFSGASNINDVKIHPDRNKILVGDSTLIDVEDVTRFADYTPSKLGLASVPETNTDIWYANAVVGGNDQTGKVYKSRSYPFRGVRAIIANYKAPKRLPEINPVIIEVELYKQTRKGKQLRKRLTCWILVYDAYRIKVEYEFTGRAGMGSDLIDSASFTVELYPDGISLNNVNNYPPQILKEGTRMGVHERIFKDGATGPVDIKKQIENFSLTRGSPDEIYFEFKEKPILYYSIQYYSKRMNIETEKVTISSKSVPEYLKFYLKREIQDFYLYKNLRVIIVPVEPPK